MIAFEFANEKDLDSLVQAVINFKLELSNFWEKNQQNRKKSIKAKAEIRNELEKQIVGNHNFYLLAKDQDQIIGICHGILKETKHLINKPIKYGYFDYVWVSAEYRNRKIASVLKSRLFTWFKKNKCKFIELKVLKSNPALNIYEKWGFQTEILTMRKPL